MPSADVANGTVQTNVVVMLYVTLHHFHLTNQTSHDGAGECRLCVKLVKRDDQMPISMALAFVCCQRLHGPYEPKYAIVLVRPGPGARLGILWRTRWQKRKGSSS